MRLQTFEDTGLGFLTDLQYLFHCAQLRYQRIQTVSKKTRFPK